MRCQGQYICAQTVYTFQEGLVLLTLVKTEPRFQDLVSVYAESVARFPRIRRRILATAAGAMRCVSRTSSQARFILTSFPRLYSVYAVFSPPTCRCPITLSKQPQGVARGPTKYQPSATELILRIQGSVEGQI